MSSPKILTRFLDSSEVPWPHLGSHPPRAATPEDQKQIFRHENFARLKWSLFEPPGMVQVFELNEQGEPQWYFPFAEPKHALAEEPVTEPPRSRMLVVLGEIEDWEVLQPGNASDEAMPEPVVIENVDGTPITVFQFICAIKEYATGLRDILCEATDVEEEEWGNMRFYYRSTEGPSRCEAGDRDAVFYVYHRPDSERCAWPLFERSMIDQERARQQPGLSEKDR